MRKFILIAGLLAVAGQPGWAADGCYTPSAMEADQAIRFVTDVMVVSATCSNKTYGEFRERNKTAILAYQKTLISHFRGTSAYDTWNTALANKMAQLHAGVPTATVCEQEAAKLQQASTFDPPKFKAYAAEQAKTAAPQYQECGRKAVRKK